MSLSTIDKCRVIAWALYEKERSTLEGSDQYVGLTRLLPLGKIVDTDVRDLMSVANTLWQRMRSPYLSWNVDDPASPIVPGTSYANIWDGTAARTANTVGVTCPTQYRQNYMGTTIPVMCWVYGERTSGGGALYVRFVTGADSFSVVVNGALGIYAVAGTVTALSGGDKMDVLAAKDVAGTTGNIYAVGMYPNVT